MTPEQAEHRYQVEQERLIRIDEMASEKAWKLSLENFEKHLPAHHLNDFYKLLDAVTNVIAEDIYNNQEGY